MPPIPKPASCAGCPFETLSPYYVPGRYRNSPVLVLGQNPGVNEEIGARVLEKHYGQEITEPCVPQPLIGATGHWLRREFWPLAQLGSLEEHSLDNVIKCRPYGLNELPSLTGHDPSKRITQPMLRQAIQHCMAAHFHPPDSVRTVVAMGSLALYAMTGQSNIGSWRGWALGRGSATLWTPQEYIPGVTSYYSGSDRVTIFATLHIAALFRDTQLYHATLRDFRRLGALVRGTWPAALPDVTLEPPKALPPVIGFDTEYDSLGKLEQWSLADTEGHVHFVDVTEWGTEFPLEVPEDLAVIAQNAIVDLPHFRAVFGTDQFVLEDCMLADAVLWPGELHNLDYMLSKYGRFNRHKHLREVPELRWLYAGLDAFTTLNDVWRELCRQFERDPQAYAEYRQRRQPLLHVLDRFQQHGIPVDHARVQEASSRFTTRLAALKAEAQALTGDPAFNLASNQQLSSVLFPEGETTHAKRDTRRAAKVPGQSRA